MRAGKHHVVASGERLPHDGEVEWNLCFYISRLGVSRNHSQSDYQADAGIDQSLLFHGSSPFPHLGNSSAFIRKMKRIEKKRPLWTRCLRKGLSLSAFEYWRSKPDSALGGRECNHWCSKTDGAAFSFGLTAGTG